MSRTLDHQWEWLRDLDFLDPRWADTEFRLREEAVSIQEQISGSASYQRSVRLLLPSRITAACATWASNAPMPAVSPSAVVNLEIYRIGGKEEVLLIEECLRRAYAGVGW